MQQNKIFVPLLVGDGISEYALLREVGTGRYPQ